MTAILLLVVRRALVSVVILFIVSALLFCILRLLPVDPAAMSMPPNATIAEIEAKRIEMGLDLPLSQQYAIWLGQVLHGDFGTSIHFRRGVAALVASTLPATIELAVLAMMVAAVLGLAGGLLMFHRVGGKAERVVDFGVDRAAVDSGISVGAVLYPAVRCLAWLHCRSPAGCRPNSSGRWSPDSCCSTRCWSAASTCSAMPSST